jgi:hypothetical protein
VIKVTEAGKEAVGAVAPGHVDTVRRHLVDLLDPAEIDPLTTIFERIRDHALDPTDLAVGHAARTDQE